MTHTRALFVVAVAALCSTGSATLSVLAHQTVTSADMFDNYPAGVNLTRWDNYEWAAATQGDFEEVRKPHARSPRGSMHTCGSTRVRFSHSFPSSSLSPPSFLSDPVAHSLTSSTSATPSATARPASTT